MSERQISAEELKAMPTGDLLGRLDELIEAMEAEDIALEDMFELYQEGLRLTKECEGRLGTMEQKLKVLHESYNGDEENE